MKEETKIRAEAPQAQRSLSDPVSI